MNIVYILILLASYNVLLRLNGVDKFHTMSTKGQSIRRYLL